MKMRKTIRTPARFLAVLFSLSAAGTPAWSENVTVNIHLAITEAFEATAPEIIDNYLVLTYEGTRTYRFAGAAFRHEDFKKIHPFYINQNGIYVLTYPLTEGISELEYRIVVDGLWMTDPENPKKRKGPDGITFSTFSIPERAGPPVSPNIDDYVVTFIYRGSPGQRVYVYGDFNNWEPYMYRLKENPENSTYTTTIRLSPGRYRYKYIVDGTALADPLNDLKTIDTSGQSTSYFTISPQ
jgi:hypothetical protein